LARAVSTMGAHLEHPSAPRAADSTPGETILRGRSPRGATLTLGALSLAVSAASPPTSSRAGSRSSSGTRSCTDPTRYLPNFVSRGFSDRDRRTVPSSSRNFSRYRRSCTGSAIVSTNSSASFLETSRRRGRSRGSLALRALWAVSWKRRRAESRAFAGTEVLGSDREFSSRVSGEGEVCGFPEGAPVRSPFAGGDAFARSLVLERPRRERRRGTERGGAAGSDLPPSGPHERTVLLRGLSLRRPRERFLYVFDIRSRRASCPPGRERRRSAAARDLR
jgi:hypothetical protein